MAELMCRELQMIEERYAERMRTASEFSDEAHLFLGTHSSRGNVCMAPSLREWISSEMRDEAAIMKERRKAREERLLLRAPAAAATTPAAGSGGGGHGRKKT